MMQLGSFLNVCDKTGVISAICIKVLGPGKNKLALLGDVVLVSIKRFNSKKFKAKKKKKRKFLKGRMHRGLLVRTKINFSRLIGLFIRFDENTVVLVNKKTVPISNRVFGPIIKEFCFNLPSLGCVVRFMI